MIKIKKNFLLLAFILTGFMFSSGIFAAEKIVRDLRVVGNVKIGEDAVRSFISHPKGAPLNPDTVTKDIKRIFDAGYFEDVKVTYDRDGTLTYTVEEKLTIRKIIVTGNKKIDAEDIRGKIKTKEYGYLNVKLVKDDLARLRELYDEKGYYLADIDYEITDLKQNEVELEIKISEERKVLIKRINILGNKVYSDSELKNVIMTKEGGFFSWLTGSGTFKDEIFAQDREMLRQFYGKDGYINVQIGEPRLYLSRDNSSLYLNVSIEEGEQYRVGKVRVSGDLIRKKEDIEKKITIRDGEIANTVKIRQDIETLTNLYADDGYAYANIMPKPVPAAGHNVVDIDFSIQKGEKVYVEKINITGNTDTRDKVIRREMQLKEGDLYSATMLRESQENLERLGYFESVRISTPVGSASDKMIINVAIKEKPTGAFQIGAGFNSLENFQFIGQLQKRNLFGYGWDVAFMANLGGRTQRFNLYFVDYWFMDKNLGLRLNLFNEKWSFIDFDLKRMGGSLGLDFPLYSRGRNRIRLSTTYSLEALKYSSITETVRNLYDDGTASSFKVTLARDTRNRIFEPTIGSLLSADATVAGGFLGGSQSYAKFDGEWRQYFLVSQSRTPFIGGAVLQFQGQIGYVMPLFNDNIPLYQKYFPGGIYTIRGFELRSLGPYVDVASGSDPTGFKTDKFRTGGNKQLLFNIEYVFPIYTPVGLKWVFFFDIGNAFASGENLNPLKLRKSLGFGIRWFSPMGPLRFEWGFPLDRKKDESLVVFDFTIGSLF